MVSVFKIYIKVYIKAAVPNNDRIFQGKPLQRKFCWKF